MHEYPARRQSPAAAVVARSWAPVGAMTITGGSWRVPSFLDVNCDHKPRPRRQVSST